MIPRFLVIDTETTGFGSSARILEIGLVFCEEGMVVDSWGQRFCPRGVCWDDPAVQDALKVNGIRPEDLQGQPDFSEVASVIDTLMSRYGIWVGHNLSFDLRMVNQEMMRLGRQLTRARTAMRVCTLEHDRLINSRERSHKLADAAARYGVKLANAHTAVADATATAELFLKMISEGKLSPLFMRRLEKAAMDEQKHRKPLPTMLSRL